MFLADEKELKWDIMKLFSLKRFVFSLSAIPPFIFIVGEMFCQGAEDTRYLFV